MVAQTKVTETMIEPIRYVYDRTIREYLPRKVGVYNTVPARHPRLLDATDRVPQYEHELCSALREYVNPSDRVVIIGGGIGVTAVVAARHGHDVVTYEAARERYSRMREAVIMNGHHDRVDCRNALVGEDVNVRGKTSKVTTDPADLPTCDVLEIDAEGAEIGILENMRIRPRIIIVETHPQFGCPNEDVWTVLQAMGYEIVADTVHDQKTGMMVLTASKDQRDQ